MPSWPRPPHMVGMFQRYGSSTIVLSAPSTSRSSNSYLQCDAQSAFMSSGVIGRHPKGGRSRQSPRLLSLSMPTATPIVAAEEELAAVTFDADGLVPAIVPEDGTGRGRMLAWMDAEALRRPLDEGRTWFWSRSRKEHWRKGDTSGDRQWVRAAYYD